MHIQAAVLRERGGAFKIEDVELAEPGPGEVLVEIAGTGSATPICSRASTCSWRSRH